MSRSISRTAALLALGCVSALMGGCGDSNERTQPADHAPIPSATADLPKRTVPRPASAFSGRDRLNYVNSKRDCRATGVGSIGATYEAEGPGRILAARAYAGNRYTPPDREAAYEGCLAGFGK